MIAHLKDRAAALAALGWTGADAEWLAFVCLQSGAFLRSQYLRYVGASHPMRARRFVQRCRAIAIEKPWDGTAFRVCRIVAQPVYRALGVEPLRHRPNATQALWAQRLLALDYVLEHRDRPWLPTEDDKVTAVTAVGVPAAVLPQRVYAGRQGRGLTRYFVKTLPVALDATGSVFVYVQAGDESGLALQSWGESHAALWAALRAKGRTVSVVVVGRQYDLLTTAEKVLRKWASAAPIRPDAAEEAAELAALISAIDAGDAARLAKHGGPTAALDRYAELEGVGGARPLKGDAPQALHNRVPFCNLSGGGLPART